MEQVRWRSVHKSTSISQRVIKALMKGVNWSFGLLLFFCLLLPVMSSNGIQLTTGAGRSTCMGWQDWLVMRQCVCLSWQKIPITSCVVSLHDWTKYVNEKHYLHWLGVKTTETTSLPFKDTHFRNAPTSVQSLPGIFIPYFSHSSLCCNTVSLRPVSLTSRAAQAVASVPPNHRFVRALENRS